VLEAPETTVEELLAFGAASSPPEMTFDADPWWEPGSAPHGPTSPAVPVNRPKTNEESETLTQEVLANLLVAFTTQYGTYTTLLWQVPALSLTAQSFLLTIALTHDSSNAARLIAAGLSIVIARVSSSLMHAQRGHAMNDGELALRISKKLHLAKHLGTLQIEDAKPEKTDAETVWMAVDHRIYHIWQLCLSLFFIADVIIVILVMISAFSGKSFGNIY
jgi:hypothetical protein